MMACQFRSEKSILRHQCDADKNHSISLNDENILIHFRRRADNFGLRFSLKLHFFG